MQHREMCVSSSKTASTQKLPGCQVHGLHAADNSAAKAGLRMSAYGAMHALAPTGNCTTTWQPTSQRLHLHSRGVLEQLLRPVRGALDGAHERLCALERRLAAAVAALKGHAEGAISEGGGCSQTRHESGRC